MTKKSLHKLLFWLIATLVLSLVMSVIVQRGWFYSWHLKSSNFLYHSSHIKVSEDIVIVAIDDKSLAVKNASEIGTLKFNKADYAKVIENLQSAGVKAIGVDIIFTEVSPPEDQQVLVETLSKYNNIILAAEPTTESTEGLKPLQKFIDPKPDNLGAILFSPDQDNSIRRQTLLFEDKKAKLSFSAQLINKYLGLLSSDSKQTDEGFEFMSFKVRVGDKRFNPITVPLDKENRLMINYFGRPYSFSTISFSDAFENKMIERTSEKELNLKDKIILIGEMGTGIHDEQYVPVSFGEPMPGVEIHANTIQTILSQKFLEEVSKQSVLLTIILIIAIGLAAFLTLNIAFSLILLFSAAVIYLMATWIFFEYGLILSTTYPHMAIGLTFITAYIYKYFSEARTAKKTEKAFAQYVSPLVVKKILEDPDQLKLGGEKKEMTVFFSDVADFTSISEQLKPEKLVTLLNDYLDSMGEIILEHEGTVDKFIGDAIVAFWGAPVPRKDHASKACLAALEYQEVLKNLRAIWRKEKFLPFYARIGIHTGEMIVGNMGSNKRFDYTVIGDTVNLGARLEGANKFYGTETLLSEETYRAANKSIEAREIDLITVKGKTKPVRIYELLSKKGELTEGQKELSGVFATALECYRAQDWKTAEMIFKNCLEINKKDGPTLTYLERIHELKKIDLPKDWDGVFNFEKK